MFAKSKFCILRTWNQEQLNTLNQGCGSGFTLNRFRSRVLCFVATIKNGINFDKCSQTFGAGISNFLLLFMIYETIN